MLSSAFFFFSVERLKEKRCRNKTWKVVDQDRLREMRNGGILLYFFKSREKIKTQVGEIRRK